MSAGKLRFTCNPADIAGSQILWICYDTPVDENDAADANFVYEQTLLLLRQLGDGALVLISSQLPAGSTAHLEAAYGRFAQPRRISFAYLPENLRLGNAIEAFSAADRIVVGVREPRNRERLHGLLSPFTRNISWMSVESAEMTKHALNAFLATSVAFINEIAAICERSGADAQDVERGLKSDVRIGNRSYLHPGVPSRAGLSVATSGFCSNSRSGMVFPRRSCTECARATRPTRDGRGAGCSIWSVICQKVRLRYWG